MCHAGQLPAAAERVLTLLGTRPLSVNVGRTRGLNERMSTRTVLVCQGGRTAVEALDNGVGSVREGYRQYGRLGDADGAARTGSAVSRSHARETRVSVHP